MTLNENQAMPTAFFLVTFAILSSKSISEVVNGVGDGYFGNIGCSENR